MSEQYKTKWNKEQNEFYLDPRWQQKRLEIFDRDKFTCIFCGCKDKTLHAHHLYYEDNLKPWEYKNHLLITLCKDCHEIESTKRKRKENNIISLLKIFGYSTQQLNKILNCFLKTNIFSYNNKTHFLDMIKLLLESDFLYHKTTHLILQQQKREHVFKLLNKDNKDIK